MQSFDRLVFRLIFQRVKPENTRIERHVRVEVERMRRDTRYRA